MPGIDHISLQASQCFQAGMPGDRVIHQCIEPGTLRIFEQIAADTIPIDCDYADGAAGMTRQRYNPGWKTIGGKISLISEEHIRSKAMGSTEAGEEAHQPAKGGIRFSAAGEHIPAFCHAQVSDMHGKGRTKGCVQPGGVTDMVEIPMGENDKVEGARGTACFFEGGSQPFTGIWAARVNQDEAPGGADQVAIYPAHTHRHRECDGLDVLVHNTPFGFT